MPPTPATTALPDRTVRLITTNRSPDIGFDRSINPYKGCEHGCVYCFARPTHAYLDLSPGLDFETKLFYKTNVREHLEQVFANPRCRPATIAMGTNTDPYQPLERKLEVTRRILETLLEYRHPVSIVTKSQLILRDESLLAELAALGLVEVFLSVTTLDKTLKTRLEPRTADGNARLKAIAALNRAGVPTGVMVAPVIPFLNDHEMETIVAAAAKAGAVRANYILLRLPGEVKALFSEWLDAHYPLKKDRILNAIRSTRGGELYRAEWGKRMRGEGPIAGLLAKRFEAAVKAAGLEPAMRGHAPLRCDLFAPRPSRSRGQQSLF